jgi:hypothetical protein
MSVKTFAKVRYEGISCVLKYPVEKGEFKGIFIYRFQKMEFLGEFGFLSKRKQTLKLKGEGSGWR